MEGRLSLVNYHYLNIALNASYQNSIAVFLYYSTITVTSIRWGHAHIACSGIKCNGE